MKERVNITIEEELLARMDEAAREEHTTRSALIRRVMREYLEEREEAEGAAPGPVHAAVRMDARSGYVGEGASIWDAVSASWPAPPPMLDETAALLRAFFMGRDDVAAAWVFGSVARGQVWSGSDVDVAVLPAEGLSAQEAWSLRSDLACRLETLLGREVDVLMLGEGSTLLRCRVVSEGVVVHGDGLRCAQEKMKAVCEHLDFAPVVREAERFWRERVERYDTVR